MKQEQKFPCVADMRQAARRRMPRFAWDYLEGGIGRDAALNRNLQQLDQVLFKPRYLSDHANHTNSRVRLLARDYEAPFAVAPIGLGGLLWPKSAEYLSAAARRYNIPFILSGFATSSLEDIASVAGPDRWYQHYACFDEAIDADLLKRAQASGFTTLVVTVDIPTATRRDHDIRNGVSVPPRFDWLTIWSAMQRPAWSLATLHNGLPEFRNLIPYLPKGANLQEATQFLTDKIEGHVSLKDLSWYRQHWSGPLLVKGILSADEARKCVDAGMDGVVVSNHGGRQLDAAQSAIEVLPEIRAAVGPEFPLLADGGIRSGLDIARYLAKGADMVLLGRAGMYAVAAMGSAGADHVLDVLRQEFEISMRQIGCESIGELRGCLVS